MARGSTILGLLLIVAVCGCGTRMSPAKRHAADVRIATERADRIAALLHGWSVLTIPSSGPRDPSCRIGVGGGEAPAVKREYDYPRTESVRFQVDFSVVVLPTAALAAKWIEMVQGPGGRECIRAATQRFYARQLKRPLRVAVIPGLPKWLHVPDARFMHGFTLVLTSTAWRHPVSVTETEVQDNRDPRVAYDFAVIGAAGVPRALVRRVVAAASA